MPESRAAIVWKALVLIGMGLMASGLTMFSIDYVWVGQFDFIERHYDIFGYAIMIGLVSLWLVSSLGQRCSTKRDAHG
jgi:hypothetical protein